MRGKPKETMPYDDSKRITPADAGKTVCFGIKHFNIWDHPRGCGENRKKYCKQRKLKGSPPRMRGKRSLSADSTFSTRITPADAGKTYPAQQKHQSIRDHPRGCGENDDIQPEFPNVTGSPPRMRGKLKDVIIEPVEIGITPADAGKTKPQPRNIISQ